MNNRLIPGWGLLAALFFTLLAGAGDASDSTYAVLGVTILVFGFWAGIILVTPEKKRVTKK